MKIDLTRQRTRHVVFSLILLGGMFMNGWIPLLFTHPTEPHLWRASDCLSLTDHYAKGNGFFEPEINNRLSDHWTTGKSVSEFPIIYYAVGKIWGIFGRDYILYRFVTFFFSLTALICLFKLIYELTKSFFASVMVPLFLMSSPIYAYYGVGFLANIPALDLNIIAAWYFYRYFKERKTRPFVYTILLITLAGLLKASALIPYVILWGIFVADLAGLAMKKPGRIFEKRWIIFVLLLIPITAFLIWYRGFVEYYCGLHGGRFALTTTWGYWTFSPEDQHRIWSSFGILTMREIYPNTVWIFTAIALTFIFARIRKVDRVAVFTIISLLVGEIIFCYLFYVCLDGHDYYFCDSLLIFISIFTTAFILLARYHQQILRSKIFVGVVTLFLVYTLVQCRVNIFLRTTPQMTPKNSMVRYFSTESEINTYNFFANMHKDQLHYSELSTELTRRGFDKNVPILSMSDFSFNVSLLMMDRPGYTNAAGIWQDSLTLADEIKGGAQLMCLDNPSQETRKTVRDLMGYPLFTFYQIGVYDLRPYKK